jgi:hypothetical protein
MYNRCQMTICSYLADKQLIVSFWTLFFSLLQWNSNYPIGKQVLQALLKAVDKRQLRFHVLCRKMKGKESGMHYNFGHCKMCKCIISLKTQRTSIFCYYTLIGISMAAVLCSAEL